MNYKVEKWPAFKVAGFVTKIKTKEAFEVVPKIWEESFKNGTINKITEFFPDYRPAGFLGIAIGGQDEENEETDYLIGATNYVEDKDCVYVKPLEGMMEYAYPEAEWVIVNADGNLPEAVQQIYSEFYSKWIPSSGYTALDLPAIESYMQEESQEIWFAVKKA